MKEWKIKRKKTLKKKKLFLFHLDLFFFTHFFSTKKKEAHPLEKMRVKKKVRFVTKRIFFISNFIMAVPSLLRFLYQKKEKIS